MDRLPLRRETPRFTVPEGCEPVEPRYDLVVIGGGLAGLSAAIQAARLGCRVCLIHNRSVLGGNFSSEVRMQIAGAAAMGRGYERFARETGIVEELGTEARWSRWHHRDVHLEPMQDLALLDAVMREPNIDLFLNAEAQMAIMAAPDRIDGVVVDQQGTERHLYIRGRFFVDASGDGRVAASSGAPYRVGREGREEYGESLAPDRPDEKVLGSSILFWVRDEGRPVPFTPPEWAYVFPDEESLPHRHHAIGEPYWWMEWGGTLDTVRDNQTIRWELTRIALGVWDHVKNRCVHKERAANYTLEWLGAVVGKRESRRFVGDWTLTQKDIEEATLFPDRIAYGGWPIDLHPPEGIFSPEEPAMQRFLRRLYSIPLRSCYSSEVTNLFLAGRLISVSHVA
ncbi:FAD-dependent oxidoreductase, partial [Limnochorda pilosa]|uniref:FAD-dependent oxidoreductase n=1 Tax=Limnochorda pilosa TaxID=1555112 RepID=UPI0026F018BC